MFLFTMIFGLINFFGEIFSGYFILQKLSHLFRCKQFSHVVACKHAPEIQNHNVVIAPRASKMFFEFFLNTYYVNSEFYKTKGFFSEAFVPGSRLELPTSGL